MRAKRLIIYKDYGLSFSFMFMFILNAPVLNENGIVFSP